MKTKNYIFNIFVILLVMLLFFLVTSISFSIDLLNHLVFCLSVIFNFLNFANACIGNYKTVKSIFTIFLFFIYLLISSFVILFFCFPLLFDNYTTLSTYKIDDKEILILKEDKEKTKWLLYEKTYYSNIFKKSKIIEAERSYDKDESKCKSLEDLYIYIKKNCPDYNCQDYEKELQICEYKYNE